MELQQKQKEYKKYKHNKGIYKYRRIKCKHKKQKYKSMKNEITKNINIQKLKIQ